MTLLYDVNFPNAAVIVPRIGQFQCFDSSRLVLRLRINYCHVSVTALMGSLNVGLLCCKYDYRERQLLW